MSEEVKGYKCFDENLRSRHGRIEWEVGKEFKQEGRIEACSVGFHFCIKPEDVFNYYDFDPTNRVCKVTALGDVKHNNDKSVTNHIRIDEEITWHEVLDLVNMGVGNTGLKNSGDRNSGYWNSGYWNSGNGNSGVFCTESPTLTFFDKPSTITRAQFINSRAFDILMEINPMVWVYSEDMSIEEKEKYPQHETTGGFLRNIGLKSAFQKWWGKAFNEEKKVILNLPNFDAEKFFEITGINVKDEQI